MADKSEGIDDVRNAAGRSILDLTDRPDVKYLRAKWRVNRWGKGDPKPLFTLYLFAQDMSRQMAAAGA